MGCLLLLGFSGVYAVSTFLAASSLSIHVKGKKHQRLLFLKEERDSSNKRSIYVRGFKNSGSIEEELTSYFSQYGKVINIFLDKEKVIMQIFNIFLIRTRF